MGNRTILGIAFDLLETKPSSRFLIYFLLILSICIRRLRPWPFLMAR